MTTCLADWCVPSAWLRTWHETALRRNLWDWTGWNGLGEDDPCAHFTDKKTEAQREPGTSPKPRPWAGRGASAVPGLSQTWHFTAPQSQLGFLNLPQPLPVFPSSFSLDLAPSFSVCLCLQSTPLCLFRVSSLSLFNSLPSFPLLSPFFLFFSLSLLLSFLY